MAADYVIKTLKAAGIAFSHSTFLSSFWGERFTFENRKAFLKAKQVLGARYANAGIRRAGKWCIEVF